MGLLIIGLSFFAYTHFHKTAAADPNLGDCISNQQDDSHAMNVVSCNSADATFRIAAIENGIGLDQTAKCSSDGDATFYSKPNQRTFCAAPVSNITTPAAQVPTGSVFDHTKVEAGVTSILTAAPPSGYGVTGLSALSCPADQPVVANTSFVCTATINGTAKPITITVKDSSGKYEVGVPN